METPRYDFEMATRNHKLFPSEEIRCHFNTRDDPESFFFGVLFNIPTLSIPISRCYIPFPSFFIFRIQTNLSYRHLPAKPRNDSSSSMMSQTLPMAAMFMRNKIMSWSSVFLALQTYLSEPINKPATSSDTASQPPLLRLAFALISLLTCYVEFFFPSTSPTLKRAAIQAAESVTSAAAEAVSTATEAASSL